MTVVLRPVSGDGVLARHGALVLLMSTPSGSEDLVSALLAAHAEVANGGGDGMALADRLGGVLSGSPATLDLVAFGPAGPALAIVVYGYAFADVATAQGEQRLALRQSRDGVRTVLPGALVSVRAGLGDPRSAPEAQRFGSLDHGVIQASGLLLLVSNGAVPQGAPAPPQPAPPQPAPPQAAPPPPQAAPPQPAPPQAAPPPLAPPEPAHDERKDPHHATPPPSPAPPGVDAAGPELVLAPDAPAEPAPPDSPGNVVLAKDLASGGTPSGPLEGADEPPGGDDEMPLIMAKPDAPGEQALLGGPPAPPVADVDRSQPFQAVSLLGPLEGVDHDRDPLPVAEPLTPAAPDVAPAPHAAAEDSVQVLGVYCKNGHFDDPAARYCAVCGISMAQQTLIPRLGPRPPLGVLVLDDGSIFTLDKDYVIGRDPSRDQDVQNSSARPLRIDDPHGQLSRVHLRIHLEGWQVEVVDLGSANGTGVWRPGDTQWTRVPPQTRIPIRPGTQVGFGRNQLRFESHTNT